jgi:hypothetical protein
MIDFKLNQVQIDSHDLTIYVLGHQEKQFELIKNRSYIHMVRLDLLEVGNFQRNDFAESRFLFTDFESNIATNYVGLASASWNKKYIYNKDQLKVCTVDFLHRLEMQPQRVWAAMVADKDWKKFTEWVHPGIDKYLNTIEEITEINPHSKSLWSNNFICHKDVMIDFLRYFRNAWTTLNDKYNWQFDYESKLNDKTRLSGMLAERVSMYYWASRKDLEILQIDQNWLDLECN